MALLARRYGKRRLVLVAMLALATVFGGVTFLGAPLAPVPNLLQLFGGVSVISMPMSALGMLPNACLADIVVHDALSTGQSNEGMCVARRQSNARHLRSSPPPLAPALGPIEAHRVGSHAI